MAELKRRENRPRSSAENARDLDRLERGQVEQKGSAPPARQIDYGAASKRVWTGTGEALVKGAKGASQALKRTAHELLNNEDLHKGVEFGTKAAWEVMKESKGRAGQKVLATLGEKRLINAAKSNKKLAKIAKVIDERPEIATGRIATELATELRDALDEYPELARELGIKIQKIKSDVYK